MSSSVVTGRDDRIARRLVAALFILGIAGLLAFGPKLHNPAGVARLDSVETVRGWFNSNVNSPRWIASLSPTCPTCASVAMSLQGAVTATAKDAGPQRPALAVVWMVALRLDHLGPSAAAVARVPSGTQFSDPRHHLADAVCASVREPEHVALCRQTPILFGVVLGWPAGPVWTADGLPEPAWMVLDPTAEDIRDGLGSR